MSLVGVKFGRWTVLEEAIDRRSRKSPLCRCECGVERNVFQSHLLNKKSQSCGCLRVEQNTKHSLHDSPIYKVYYGMRGRCVPSNHLYGGRGIKVAKRWLGKRGFQNFLKDVGERPSVHHSLDRIDGDKGYTPSNVRWATKREQSLNRRKTAAITSFSTSDLLKELKRRKQ